MQGDIPSDIFTIVEQCSSDPDSVSWNEVERVAQFFTSVGCGDLGNQMLQVQSDVAAGKYEVIVDRDDVEELQLVLGRRRFPFPYTHGENLDEAVKRLIKKHNLADGNPPSSAAYRKVFSNVKAAISSTISRFQDPSSPPRPVYSESHLDRPKTPEIKDGDTVASSATDGTSARDVQDSLAQMRKMKSTAAKQNDSKCRTPSQSSSSLSSVSTTPKRQSGNSSASNGQQSSTPKEKFVLKPPKRLPKRSPQKRGNIGTVASLSKSEEKTNGIMRGVSSSGPQIAPSFGRSNGRPSRKRSRQDVEVRAREVVRMVSDMGEKNAKTKLKQLGITGTELRVIENRLDAWKTCVAEELLGSRSSRRQPGRPVPHYMIDDEEDDDNRIATQESFDEHGFVDDTREELDEELDTYFQLGRIVWARTPNQKYFRRGQVMDNMVGNDNIRVQFFDGKSPNNKYFHVEFQSPSLRRTQPPIDLIHIDSDDFVFRYTTDTRRPSDDDVDAPMSRHQQQQQMIDALTKLTKIYQSVENQRSTRDDSDDVMERRGPRRSYDDRFGSISANGNSSADFNFDDLFDRDDEKNQIEFHLDDNAEKIAVRIRLKSNDVVDAEFNTTHTVRDVRNYLDLNHPVKGSYKLILGGFPRKELNDDGQNVMDAQLKNSQILQR